MNIFCNLELLEPYLHTRPLYGLHTIKWRAEQILQKRDNKRTPEQIDCAATLIRSLIDDFKAQRASEEFEHYICRLYERGGWELEYLENFHNDRQPTLKEIRNLLENWPSWADDRPSVPQAEDFDDLDSLQEILDSGYPFDDMPDFPGATEYECYAVLALMKLEVAAGFLFIANKPRESGTIANVVWTSAMKATIEAGNNVVDAMEIVCYAERKLAEVRIAEWASQQKQRLDEEALREREEKARQERSEKAGMLAKMRWAEDSEKRKSAMGLIKSYWDMWSQDRSLYRNQGEFARDMEEKIDAQIGRGRKQELLYSATTIEVKLIPKIRNA